MKNKSIILLSSLLTLALVGCKANKPSDEPSIVPSPVESETNSIVEENSSTEEVSSVVEDESSEEVISSEDLSSEEESSSIEEKAEFSVETEVVDGYEYDELNNKYVFSVADVYTLSGELEGSIECVDTLEESITFNLNNFTCISTDAPCIYWKAEAKKVKINTLEGTVNYLTVEAKEEGEACAIESENNIDILGEGELHVSSAQKHAVKGSDIEVSGGINYFEDCAKDGLHGKAVSIIGGTNHFEDLPDGDGVEAELTKKGKKGSISITGGENTFINCACALKAAASIEASGTEENTLKIMVKNVTDNIVVPDEGLALNFVEFITLLGE